MQIPIRAAQGGEPCQVPDSNLMGLEEAKVPFCTLRLKTHRMVTVGRIIRPR